MLNDNLAPLMKLLRIQKEFPPRVINFTEYEFWSNQLSRVISKRAGKSLLSDYILILRSQ